VRDFRMSNSKKNPEDSQRFLIFKRTLREVEEAEAPRLSSDDFRLLVETSTIADREAAAAPRLSQNLSIAACAENRRSFTSEMD
jgi:hypothetical protein